MRSPRRCASDCAADWLERKIMKAISSEGISKGRQCSAETSQGDRRQPGRNLADDPDAGLRQVEDGDRRRRYDQDHHRRQLGEHLGHFARAAERAQGARQVCFRQPQGKQRSQPDGSRSAGGLPPAARRAAARSGRR
jgi:hypothetical protein